MLLETASTSILVSILRKGKFKNLEKAYIHGWYLLFIAGILQVMLKIGLLSNYFYPIVILSYLLILSCLALNYYSRGMMIAFIGTLLNFIVISANGGFMPVSLKSLAFAGYDISQLTSNYFDTFHSIIIESTHFTILADIIPIPEPYPFPQVLSIGDLFIMVGVFMFIQEIMFDKKSNKSKLPFQN